MLLLSDPVTEGLFSLGTGVIGGIASLFGADSQSKNVKRTNEMNYKIAQEANANQLQIARENNQLQLDAMRENNAFNKQSAIDMFNMEAAYNSPEAQKERLLAAGINPATLYGQGGSVAGSVNASTPSASSSGVSPSMPSFSVPTMQAPPSVLNTMFGNIESLTRAVGNIAKSGLDSMTKRSLAAKLGPEIDKIVSETEDVKIQNEWNNFKMSLDKANLNRRQEKEIERLSSDIFKAYAEGGAAHAQIALDEALTELRKTENRSLVEQIPWLVDNLKKLGELYVQKANTEKTSQVANIASAHASEASAKNQRKLARVAELDGDAKEILNEFLPEQVVLDMSMKDLDIIDKIFTAGRANNVPNLVDKLVTSGVREDIAKAVNEAMERRKKYLNRYHKYLSK